MSEENKLKTIIEKSSEIGGGLTGAVIGLVVAGPAGVLGGALVGPICTSLFKKVGTEISERFLGKREEIRVGATLSLAYNNIQKKIDEGQVLRNDDFYNSNSGERSGAETILEGTLLKARNEYEEKKIKYYANFLANVNIDSSISFEKGNTILRIIEQLSYRQFVMLAYFKGIDELDIDGWMVGFSEKEELGIHQDFYSELIDLYNQQLLQQAGKGISMSIRSLKISPLGKTLYNLLELDIMDEDDKSLIEKTISEVRSLKQ
ncbi:MAG: hypothetical protein ACI93S_001202 [Ancylomarina sp.]|jgi:hypothetical protein